MKKCPYCAEQIRDEAVKCKHCGSRLDGGAADSVSAPGPADTLDGARTVSAETIAPGRLLAGRYLIERRLGSGGMGEVWKAADGQTVDIRVPMEFRVRSGRKEIVLPDGATGEPGTRPHGALVLALAKAYRWQRMIECGEVSGMEEIAKRVGVDRSYVARILQLTSLAPEFVQAIVAGREPNGMSLVELRRGFPTRWDEQRRMWSSQ